MSGDLPDITGSTPCQEVDPDMFFPLPGANSTAEKAKTLCRRCPTPSRDACLAYSLNHRVTGVWGATTDREREKLRKAKGIKPAAVGISTTWARAEQIVRMFARGTPVDAIAEVTEMTTESVRQVLKRRAS